MGDPPGSRSDAAESTDDAPARYCRLGGVMELLSRRYAVQVIRLVGAIGSARYGEIEAVLGDVSSSTLSTQFDDLVEAESLEREQYAAIPSRVEYDLSPTDVELRERLDPLLERADTQDL